MRTFAIFGARVAQRRCPIASNLGQKYLFSDRSKRRLGVGFAHLGWTATFYPDRVSATKHVWYPVLLSFLDFTLDIVRNFRTETITARVGTSSKCTLFRIYCTWAWSHRNKIAVIE